MTKSPRMIVFLFLALAMSLSWNFSHLYAQTNPITVQVASYLKASDAEAAVADAPRRHTNSAPLSQPSTATNGGGGDDVVEAPASSS